MKFSISSALLALSCVPASVAFVVPMQSTPKTMGSSSSLMMEVDDSSTDTEGRRAFIVQSATASVAAVGAASIELGMPAPVEAAPSKMWKKVEVPFEDTVYDIDFDSATHGYLVGARGAFAETNNGGVTWEPRAFSNLDAEEEINYRFQIVSFKDGEGWVLGRPTLMLHTKDSGKSWERIPLSPKLPGDPVSVRATGPSTAEMTTSSGAIYTTENAGRNWKAQVKETIDATLNRISSSGVSGASYYSGSIVGQTRDEKGSYLAVSSRGNFFLTWAPGQEFWIPHNRGTPRRIQAMGFVQGDLKKGVWMTLNGGKLYVADKDVNIENDSFPFTEAAIKTGGYGITDVTWKDENEVWAVGGSNTMFVSMDGGKTFNFDKSATNYPGNLYNVKFFKEYGNMGWALGSNGVLLQYVG